MGVVKLLIASPPCQAWSMAGKREGLRDQRRVFDLCGTWAADPTAPRPEEWIDERSPLAAEPMRWAATLRPELMAWEQVPPVLDLWSHCAQLLGAMGYSTWTGILSAERYGVPQTRKRAILLASRVSTVHPPMPTHQAYVAGEPARHDFTLEGEILPWISMAEALGWTGEPIRWDSRTKFAQAERTTDDPAATLTAQGLAKGRDVWRVGFPRKADNGEATENGYRERDFRDETEPAFTVTDKARSAIKMRANGQENGTERGADEPAPTIKGGHDSGDRVWMRMGDRVQPGGGNKPRPADEPSATLGTRTDLAEWTEERPAPTIVGTRRSDEGMIVGRQLPEGEGRNVGGRNWTGDPKDPNWPNGRPSTTLTGDPRVPRPGHHGTPDEGDRYGGPQMRNAVRVTTEEASILQSFPPDYARHPGYRWQLEPLRDDERPLIDGQTPTADEHSLDRPAKEVALWGRRMSDRALQLLEDIGGWVRDEEVEYHLDSDAVFELHEAVEQGLVTVRVEFSLTSKGEEAVRDA